MSIALERVIAEQQKEIDTLKLMLEAANASMARKLLDEEEVFRAFSKITTYSGLRGAWHTDKRKEWDEYHSLLHEGRMTLMDAGWCFNCATLNCMGDCRD